MQSDHKIVEVLSRSFDRPAFTTPFRQEVNIPDFEKAITDTVEVLNTGMYRLRDGTLIEKIKSRHEIADISMKAKVAVIYDQVLKLRNTFMELRKAGEIQPCGCGDIDCAVYTLTDTACQKMDVARNSILSAWKKILN